MSMLQRQSLIFLGLSLLAVGCDACNSQPQSAQTPKADAQRYSVRGVVRALPVEKSAHPEIAIQHEAIPTFRNRKGEEKGMPTMVMNFSFAKTVPIDTLKPGDKVRIDLRVDWNAADPFHITALETLPANTALTLDQP